MMYERWSMLGMVGLTAVAVVAGPARQVKIETRTMLQGVHPGTFTTSGAGLCRRGTSRDKVLMVPRHSGGHWSFHFRKTFTCADRSGTFVTEETGLRLDGAVKWHGRWTIVAGTGAYAALSGAGTLVGDELPGSVNDHLVGSISFG